MPINNIHNGWSRLPAVERTKYDRDDYVKSPNRKKQGKTHAKTVAMRLAAGYGREVPPDNIEKGKWNDTVYLRNKPAH